MSSDLVTSKAQEEATAAAQLDFLRGRGSNQWGVRQYNERVVLDSLRFHGRLPKAELARMTGLTAQAIGIISVRLEKEGLILRQLPVRGKVGQPSVPLSLNPAGAYAVGIKIGRRQFDCVRINFLGRIEARVTYEYNFSELHSIIPLLYEKVECLCQELGDARERLIGIGVAAPFHMDGWKPLLGVPEGVPIQNWQTSDITQELRRRYQLPVGFVRDTSAACLAELVSGKGRELKHFLYIFVDTFVGGGLVLNSLPYFGLHGNAGAIGSVSLALAQRGTELPTQLLAKASLWELEQTFKAQGLAAQAAYDARSLQAPYLEHTRAWLQDATSALAQCVVNGTAFLDIEHIVIDGSFNPALRKLLLEETQKALHLYSWEGLRMPILHTGSIGADAIACGGALLPLHEQFAPDTELFLKAL